MGALVAALAGCGSNSSDGGSNSGATGTINFMTWTTGASVDAATKQVAKLYEQTHPGTKVNVTILPYDQYGQKLQLAIAGGKTPDIFQADSSAVRLVEAGKVLNLDSYFKSDPVLSDPNQTRTQALSMDKFDGTHIDAFPLGGLCGMELYYNKDLFKRAGVAYPTDSWTWTDFENAAKKLTIVQDGKTVQWGTQLGYLEGWDGGWQTVAASNGMGTFFDQSGSEPKLNVDDPQVASTWQFMQDLVYKDKVAPDPQAEKAFNQSGGAFASGKVAMVPDGCWQLGPYQTAVKNLGMAKLPMGTTGKSIGPIWGTNMMIAKDSSNTQLAWNFLRWWTVSPEAMEPYAKAGAWCGPAIVKKFDSLMAKTWASVPGGDACLTSLDGAENFAINTPNWNQVYTNVISPMWTDKFLEDKMTPDELVSAINSQANGNL